MKNLHLLIIWLVGLIVPCLSAEVDLASFIEEVAESRQDDTNRVYYAGCSNEVHYLYHKTQYGVKEWRLKNVRLEATRFQEYTSDENRWLIIKDSADDYLRHWDINKCVVDFVSHLPEDSALVELRCRWYEQDGSRQYEDGTPHLISKQEYAVLSTLSRRVKIGDIIEVGWLVDCYSSVTNIVSRRDWHKRDCTRDGKILYITWDRDLCFRDGKGRVCINDGWPVPITLVWDSDPEHEGLVRCDERMVWNEYKRVSCGKCSPDELVSEPAVD